MNKNVIAALVIGTIAGSVVTRIRMNDRISKNIKAVRAAMAIVDSANAYKDQFITDPEGFIHDLREAHTVIAFHEITKDI